MFTVLQNAIGEEIHEPMLRLTEAHHRAWARRHGYVYESYFGREFDDADHVYWEKEKLALRWMRNTARGARLVFLDPDALVLRPWHSPSEMLPAWANLGLSWVKDLHRINFGVFALANDPAVEAFFQKVLDLKTYEGRPSSFDEGRIMYELGVGDGPPPAEPFEKDGLRIHWLGPEWNRYAHNRSNEPTIIRAWHGGDKVQATAEMQAELEGIARNVYSDPDAA